MSTSELVLRSDPPIDDDRTAELRMNETLDSRDSARKRAKKPTKSAPSRKPSRGEASPSKVERSLERRVLDLERELAKRTRELERDQLESARTESLARSILAAVLDPTITIDERGAIVSASASVERVFGWRPEELVGKNIKLLMPEPHRAKHDSYLSTYNRTGRTNILGRTREFEVVAKDGRRIQVELSVSRVDFAGEGRPLFTGSFRDVTQRRLTEERLRESEARFHAIFDQSFEYIGLLTPEGIVLEANQTALDSTGLSREEVLGKPFWETRWWPTVGDAREKLQRAVRAAASGEFVRYETENRGRGDELRTIDFSIKPVCDASGKVVQLIPEGRDITELKRAQRAETAMLRALATVGESAAMLAHEIKNPITAVNLALRAVAQQLGEDHKQVLEDLVTRMQRVEQLMRRTLTFTKPLELKLSTIDASELISKALGQLRPQIIKSGYDVRTHLPESRLQFEGDRQLLEEVITNLLRNALEAQPNGGRIEITLERAPRSARVLIDDNGPGIAESVRGTLFQPFVTTKQQGTGLGLPFCKKVIEQHGGSIAAGSSPLGGARFSIEMPTQ
ncbi:MAG: PAS domain S-box protein [Planctomycetes bacterium]|nr:PAS domain S-box protein [Planctomycetota bacterium]